MTVQGLDRLQRKLLRKIPDSVRDATRNAMAEGAARIVGMMKTLAPVKTGALRHSIGWTWGEAPSGSMAIGQIKPRRAGDEVITIYAGTRNKALGRGDAFYARFVEFGTVKMSARPFFYVSYRQHRKAVKSRVNRAMKKALKAAAA